MEEDFLPNTTYQVTSPSGAEIVLLSEKEVEYYNVVAERYQKDNIFTNIADIQELDRVLVMEVMCYRWSLWLLEERDYFGEVANVQELQKNINEYSREIRLVKKALGVDKATRDKDHGDSPAEYIHNLRLRAAEFGIMRNKQAAKAIELWMELVGKVTLFQNCDDQEKKEFHADALDVIDWILAKVPEFDQIDKEFRETSQKYWVREI